MRRAFLIIVTLAVAILLAGCLGNGTYQVTPTLRNGTVSVGLWHSEGGDGCYWERLSGFGGSFEEIIANNFSAGGPQYVEIKSTDAGFKTSGCEPWHQAGGPLDVLHVITTTFQDGQYLTGKELPAGTYQASDKGDCYWERVSSFDGAFASIIANDLGGGLVTVQPGDYGLSTSGCGTWTKIG